MLLVYVEGSESFLVPHAGRTFLNSLASQKKLFGYEPDTDISVLLLDLQDSGNAVGDLGAPQRADGPYRAAVATPSRRSRPTSG